MQICESSSNMINFRVEILTLSPDWSSAVIASLVSCDTSRLDMLRPHTANSHRITKGTFKIANGNSKQIRTLFQYHTEAVQWHLVSMSKQGSIEDHVQNRLHQEEHDAQGTAPAQGASLQSAAMLRAQPAEFDATKLREGVVKADVSSLVQHRHDSTSKGTPRLPANSSHISGIVVAGASWKRGRRLVLQNALLPSSRIRMDGTMAARARRNQMGTLT